MKRITMILLTAIFFTLSFNSTSSGKTVASFDEPEFKSAIPIIQASWYWVTWREDFHPQKSNDLFTLDLGSYFNTGKSYNWGASLHVAIDDQGARFGLAPRMRSWFSDNISLELSPKLIIAGAGIYDVGNVFPSYAISASLTFRNLLSFDAYYQLISQRTDGYRLPNGNIELFNGDKREKSFYLGVSGHTYLAAAVPAVALLVAALTYDETIIE